MKYRLLIALPIAAALVLVSCGTLPAPQQPGARAFVAGEVAALTPAGDYRYEIIDFSDLDETTRGLTGGGARFSPLRGGAGFEPGRRVAGDDAPPRGRFVGSTEHLRLVGDGRVRLAAPATVLGMHVVLPAGQVRLHRQLFAGTETRLLVTGIDAAGRETASVWITPAWSTPATTRVETQWTWVDLSMLGEVAALEMTFESPLTESPVLLVDNLTVSKDFRADDAFFSVAVLPSAARLLAAAPDALAAQTRFLTSHGPRSDQRILYVSHLGGLVPDGADEEQWERTDFALRALDRAIPWGTALGVTDLQDPDEPVAGAPLFLEHFGEDRFEESQTWRGASPDGYSSYHILETRVGPVLALQLGVDPAPETADWAQDVLDRHRDVPTIVTSGAYLSATSRVSAPLLTAAPGTEQLGMSAEALWERLIWANGQVFLVLCGPAPGAESVFERLQISRNRFEQPVLEMMAGAAPWSGAPEGYVRLLRFYPARNEMRAVTYFALTGTYDVGADSHFVVPLDISGRLGLE